MSTTIGSLSTSTTSNIRGYGGLASGLDRDSLIEGMTYGTTSKITAQQQKKQQLEWKQEAVQSITNLMLSFANKYTSSFSSATNLFSSVFWGRSNITTTGANSKYVSVSGSASSSDAVTIMGVKQLAQKAKTTSASSVSDGKLQTGTIDVKSTQTVENLIGKSLDFKYGDKTTTVFLNLTDSDGKAFTDEDGNELNYQDPVSAAQTINKILEQEEISLSDGTSKKLSELVKVEVNDAGNFEFKNVGGGGNNLYVTGGTALDVMGFEEPEGDGFNLTAANAVKEGTNGTSKITSEVSFAEKIAGKSLSFNYNGVTKSIKIASQETLMDGVDDSCYDADGKLNSKGEEKVLGNLQASIQKEMDSVFGKGRIKVGLDNKQLSFVTTNPATGDPDTSSSLTITAGSTGLLGEKGALSVKAGESTSLNLNAKLSDAGFKGLTESVPGYITINGEKIEVNEDDTVQKLMDRIKEKTGVTVSYQSLTGKFTFTSEENGVSGSISFGSFDEDGKPVADTASDNLLNQLFGVTAGTKVQGQDAIVTVKYAGSDEEVDLYRDSNTFTLDGLTISVKGEFGYKEKEIEVDGTEQAKDENGTLLVDENNKPIMEKIKVMVKERDYESEEVEINASVNTDSIIEAIKAMAEEYNAIVDQVNKELTTKPDRDYSPLTSEQKAEMSDSDIELWESKCKEGLLFGDSDLRNLASDLRFVISGGNLQAMSDIGISTSSTYSDNGKLVIDESKLRAALESDPEKVEKLFTSTASKNADGTETYDGIATNLKAVMSKYVETMGAMESKGVLIRKAGSEASPLSVTDNTIYKQIAEINKQIATLQTRLESERDRYISQFTSLETLISQMNSQASWLAQIGGSY